MKRTDRLVGYGRLLFELGGLVYKIRDRGRGPLFQLSTVQGLEI